MPKKKIYVTSCSQDTEKLGTRLAPSLKNSIIFLYGNLGAGKTTFVRGLARGLKIKNNVVSPTFTYQRMYGKGDNLLYHFDLYRITELGDTLLEEEINTILSTRSSTIAIEWPDKLKNPTELLKIRNFATIYFDYKDDTKRMITIEYS